MQSAVSQHSRVLNCAFLPGYVRCQGLIVAYLEEKSVRNVMSRNGEAMTYVTAFDFRDRTGRLYCVDRDLVVRRIAPAR